MPLYEHQGGREDLTFSCVAVAFYNAMVWGKFPVSRQLLLDFCQAITYDPLAPVGLGHMRGIIARLEEYTRPHLAIVNMRIPSIEKMEQHLRAGGAVLLDYEWPDPIQYKSAGHMTLLVNISRRGNLFYAANYFRDSTRALQRVPRSVLLNEACGERRGGCAPTHAWRLTRVSKPNWKWHFKNFWRTP